MGRQDYGRSPRAEYRGQEVSKYENRPRPTDRFTERANPRRGDCYERRRDIRNPGNGAEVQRHPEEKERVYRGPYAEQSQSIQQRASGTELRRNQYTRQGARPREEDPREPESKGKLQGQHLATIAIPDEPSGKKKNGDVISIIRLKRVIEEVTSEMKEEQAKTAKRTRMPTVTLKFETIEIEALMDTGANFGGDESGIR